MASIRVYNSYHEYTLSKGADTRRKWMKNPRQPKTKLRNGIQM